MPRDYGRGEGLPPGMCGPIGPGCGAVFPGLPEIVIGTDVVLGCGDGVAVAAIVGVGVGASVALAAFDTTVAAVAAPAATAAAVVVAVVAAVVAAAARCGENAPGNNVAQCQ